MTSPSPKTSAKPLKSTGGAPGSNNAPPQQPKPPSPNPKPILPPSEPNDSGKTYFVGSYSDLPGSPVDKNKDRDSKNKGANFASRSPPFLDASEKGRYEKQYRQLITSEGRFRMGEITEKVARDYESRARRELWSLWYRSRWLWRERGLTPLTFDPLNKEERERNNRTPKKPKQNRSSAPKKSGEARAEIQASPRMDKTPTRRRASQGAIQAKDEMQSSSSGNRTPTRRRALKGADHAMDESRPSPSRNKSLTKECTLKKAAEARNEEESSPGEDHTVGSTGDADDEMEEMVEQPGGLEKEEKDDDDSQNSDPRLRGRKG